MDYATLTAPGAQYGGDLWPSVSWDNSYVSENIYGSPNSEEGSFTSSPPTSPFFDYSYNMSASAAETGSSPRNALSMEAHGSFSSDTSPISCLQTDTSEDPPAFSGRDHPVYCLVPNCPAKPFKRRADLDRHYKHKHVPDERKKDYSFSCDYERCARRTEPFHRRDHFRDHLREFHKEDIEKRGFVINEEWLEGRNLNRNWWRCPKCLKRVYIADNKYVCPGCKSSCQSKRKDARRHA